MNNHPFVITIGRSLGSGGRLIGSELARRFSIRFLDKEVLKIAAGQSGIAETFFEKADERKGFFSILGDLMSPISAGLSSLAGGGQEQLSRENLFQLQSDAIREVASQESCVIVGRCADYVLREHPRLVRIFICANRADRIKRIATLMQVSEQEARRRLRAGDASRAQFYNFYNGTHRWGEARTYDLCINSSILGIERTTDLLEQFIRATLKL